VWTQEELNQVAEICGQRNVYVISDEIHGDFAYPPHQYTPYLKGLDNENAATCLSPGKTFNISGLVDAVAVLPNDEDRQQFHDFCERYQMNHVNVFGTLAMDTAYREGAEWLTALIDYIKGNVDYLRDFLKEEELGVSLIEPEGTYLAWLDFRKLGMDAQALAKFLAEEAGIAVAFGHWYGKEGAGFARITLACPRITVQNALTSLSRAIKRLP
jgi:cystathionine beta-lyase